MDIARKLGKINEIGKNKQKGLRQRKHNDKVNDYERRVKSNMSQSNLKLLI